MAITFQEGDHVQVVSRDVTSDDQKSGLYFNHYRNLTGLVQKLYDHEQVAVEVALESLPPAIAKHHQEVQHDMKTKWLENLSDSAQSRLTPAELAFRLRYTILVRTADLMTPTLPTQTQQSEEQRTPRRLTEVEISAAEEAELKRRQSK